MNSGLSMDKTPFFSIIIPTFNSSKTLADALDSITKQAFVDFEILIIDGISTDNTVEIANAINDSRIKVYAEKDKGIYDAMNKGIKYASGKWLYFLGSDDELFNSSVLETVYTNAKNIKNGIIYGNVLIKGDAGWASDGQLYNGRFLLADLLNINICHQSIFYNKKALDQLGDYNIHYSICADYDLTLRCAAKYQLHFIPLTIATFNGGGASVIAEDIYFGNEKWVNIISYFKTGIFKRAFVSHIMDIRRTFSYLRSNKKYYLFSIALLAFYFHKISSRFSCQR
jgi:glycosyltransferase involved in cell wall biosynthesis